MSEHIVNIDEQNAAQLLIEESYQRPVVVDFWADWCEPCKVLMPLLEKIANEYSGAFLLAKVNADEQGMITQQFGVRSLPTVMVIKDGQPVDGFAGAQPENAVRELLAKYLPQPWDGLLELAREALQEGRAAEALGPLRQAWEDSGRKLEITLLYARALIEAMRLDEAESVLTDVRLADQDAAYEQLVAQIELKREAAKTPEIAALEAKLAEDPDNLDIRHQLALQFTSSGQFREAMEHLITILRVDLEHADGASRKTLLDTIASLGKGDPLAAEYQRKLYSLLY